jgi:hypothetical protein
MLTRKVERVPGYDEQPGRKRNRVLADRAAFPSGKAQARGRMRQDVPSPDDLNGRWNNLYQTSWHDDARRSPTSRAQAARQAPPAVQRIELPFYPAFSKAEGTLGTIIQ